MREIKARGYNEHDEIWVYGSYVDGYIINGVIESTDEYIAIEMWAPVALESVGQYTGLKDRKSREIYEGDIVQDKKKRKYIVTFNSEIGSWVNKPVAENATSYPCFNVRSVQGLEVIGNIFENPELLN